METKKNESVNTTNNNPATCVVAEETGTPIGGYNIDMKALKRIDNLGRKIDLLRVLLEQAQTTYNIVTEQFATTGTADTATLWSMEDIFAKFFKGSASKATERLKHINEQ